MKSRIYKIIKEANGNHLLRYRQFTIDLIERCDEIVENDDLNEETMVGAIRYEIDTAMEIMDKGLEDHAFLKELFAKIRNEYEK